MDRKTGFCNRSQLGRRASRAAARTISERPTILQKAIIAGSRSEPSGRPALALVAQACRAVGRRSFAKSPRSIGASSRAAWPRTSSWTGQNGLPSGRPRRRGACLWRNAIHGGMVSSGAAAVLRLRTAFICSISCVQLARARRIERLGLAHTRSPCGSSVCSRRCLVLAGARPKRRDGRSRGCGMLLCTRTDDTDAWNRVLSRVATRVGGVS